MAVYTQNRKNYGRGWRRAGSSGVRCSNINVDPGRADRTRLLVSRIHSPQGYFQYAADAAASFVIRR